MKTKSDKYYFKDSNQTIIDIGGGNNNYYFRMYCEKNYNFPSIGVMVDKKNLKYLADFIYEFLSTQEDPC